MKQFFKYFFAALLALTVGSVLFFIVFFAMLGSFTKSITDSFSSKTASKPSTSILDNSILVVDITQPLGELGQSNSLAMFTGGTSEIAGLYDMINAIEHAKNDSKIKGIYLKAGGSGNSLATLQQIRENLVEFKSEGKFIYAYGDNIPQTAYYVASVADSIFVSPLGSVELKGLASQVTFFKGTLDKLDVKPEIFYCGEFKSATEPFRVDKMTEQNRQQLAHIQSDFWSEIVRVIAERAKVDVATVNEWANVYKIRKTQDAIDLNLIEGVKYKNEIEDLLRTHTGQKESEELNLVSISKYASSIVSSNIQDRIAILVGEGQIIDGTSNSSNPEIASEDFIKEIRRIKDNDKIKAVVLRVNSPGGSALASEHILHELLLLKEKKPLVVTMGDLAASGGYYIACGADSIFAMSNTITGSIGVFGMMFNTQGLFNKKLGITFDTEKTSQMADFPNLNRPMTASEKEIIQGSVDEVYAIFKNRVATGRNMDVTYVDSIGQGRIWSGKSALQLGLVDAIGGLNRAIAAAASLADISDYKIVTYPQKQDMFEKILKSIGGKTDISQEAIAEALIKHRLEKEYGWMSTIFQLQNPSNTTWAIIPYHIEIK